MDITMTEAQIKDAIVKMSNSEEYLELRKYYREESFFKTLGISRDENVHSDFIAWLLRPTSNHELYYYPLCKFLQMLAIVCEKDNNANAQFSEEYANKFLLEDYELTNTCIVKREESTGDIPGFDNSGRIDILLELTFKDDDKILPIIIENKVLSTENDENTKSKPNAKNKQTEKYFEWSKLKYSNTNIYKTPLLIFLAPDFEKDINCKCDAFIKVSYQNLIDYIIEPCLMNVTSNQTRVFIENYLRCLSNTTINDELNKNEGRIMGFISKEKELLEKFHEKNKNLFDAVLTMLANDENLTPEDRQSMKRALNVSDNKDYSKYMFEGQTYGKGKLVLAVVKKYVDDNPTVSFADLQKAFPDSLQGAKGVVRLSNLVSPGDKGIDGVKRYYVNDSDVINIDGKKVLVSDQWGAGNIEKFIKNATENLNYDIQKV